MRVARLLTVLLLHGSLLAAAAAGAATDRDRELGWSACAWAAGHEVTVGVSPEHPFPDPAYSERLDDAVRRWDSVLRATGQPTGMVRQDDGPDIVVEYRPADDGASAGSPADGEDVLGETSLARVDDPDRSTDLGRCPDRVGPFFALAAATIRITPRDDWFTGDDADVGQWQNCTGALMQIVFSSQCAARVDFGSTITHELGHALVLYHPETLDRIDGVPTDDPDSATRRAACVEVSGDADGQATMCEGQTQWRADQRSLASWDVDTVSRQYRDPISETEPPPPPDPDTTAGPGRGAG